MKKKAILLTLAGLGLGAATQAQTTALTLTGLDIRPGATGGIQGVTESEGTLAFAAIPGMPSAGNQGSPLDFVFDWTGLDLDGVGGADDSISFTLRGTAGGTGTDVNFNDQGLGVNGSQGAGETVMYELVGLSSSLGGSFSSVGFTGLGVNGQASAGAGNPTEGWITADVNGVNTEVIISGTAYTYQSNPLTFALTSTVTVDNIVQSAIAGDPPPSLAPAGETPTAVGAVWLRGFDISITHTVPEPSAFALLAGTLALGAVMIRRRRS